MAARIGPMQGVQPAANARPLNFQALLSLQQADRRDAQKVQAHHDDHDPGQNSNLVRVETQQRTDRARTGAERHKYAREPGDEQHRRSERFAPHPPLRLRIRKPLQRGAGKIDQIGRYQRQHAGRQKAHQPRQQRGYNRGIRGHGGYMRQGPTPMQGARGRIAPM